MEGRITEKQVYSSWIPLVNPALRVVDFLQEVDHNKVIIVSGEGFPQLFHRLAPSLADIQAHGNIDRFVLSVDSEEMDFADKLVEVTQHIAMHNPAVPVFPIVQHYCFETWALGNRVIGSKRPTDPDLAEFKRAYDVATLDPAVMQSIRPRLNRAQFSELYLRRLLNDQHKGLTYSKSNPSLVCHRKYFDQVRRRLQDTGHIASFHQFISAFT